MQKPLLIGAVIALVVIVGAGALLFSNKSDKASNSSSNSTALSDKTMMTNGQGEETGKDGTSEQNDNFDDSANSIGINSSAFNPADLTVKKGARVTWTNKDSVAHTATKVDGQTGPDSGSIAPGESYSFTFDTVGTFKYLCTFHPNMTGTVTVTE